jgi:hypothetical protein
VIANEQTYRERIMAIRAGAARRVRRTAFAAAFTVVTAFTLTGTPAAAAGVAGVDLAGPRYTYYYYSEPEFQNLVGVRVVTFCPDVPVEEWGEQTQWFQRYRDWVECPS